MAAQDGDDFVPEEIEDDCTECHKALAAVDSLLKPAMAVSKSNLEEELSPLDAASLMLLFSYTMNSLFWVYLTTQGMNPQTHAIKGELDRIQKIMKRCKTIGDSLEPVGVRLNKDVAKRLVRGVMWEANQGGGSGSGTKRLHSDDDSEPNSKRTSN